MIEIAQYGDANDDARVTICHFLNPRHKIACGLLALECPAATVEYLHKSTATLCLQRQFLLLALWASVHSADAESVGGQGEHLSINVVF